MLFFQKIRDFVNNSLRGKIAMFFMVFASLIIVEMIILSILRGKALALPKQIEVTLDAQYYLQESRLSFQQFVDKVKTPDEALAHLAKSESLLQILIKGGQVNGKGFQFKPMEGSSKLSTERLIEMIRKQKSEMIDSIILLANFVPPASTTSTMVDSVKVDSTQTAAIDTTTIKAKTKVLAISNAGTEMKTEFDHLIELLRTEMGERQSMIAILMAVVVVIDIGLLGFFFFFMSKNVSNPLKEIAEAASQQRFSETKTTDEVGVVAANLNGIIRQLNDATIFIKSIGEGKLDLKLDVENQNSLLSQALMSMQQKLKAINDEEQKRKWANEGLTKFVEIIRSAESDLSKLGDNIIKGLVTYTGANQGGLYVWNDDNPDNKYIELVSAYAYNRKKFEEAKIKAGEGLLGQVYLEKLTTYLTEIPADYFKIVSGLGETDPQAILIVPLLSDGNVYGLVELASLKKFADHEIAFVEKLGETIASTLASVKANERTRKLLVDFQQQTENLRSQEEEMRQNMEELTATQEAAQRQNDEAKEMFKTVIDILNQLPQKVFLKDQDGKMVLANENVAKAHGMSIDQLIGKSDFDFVDAATAQDWRNQELEIIKKGREEYTFEETLHGHSKTLHTIKLAFYIPHLKQTGLLGIQTDVTELEQLKKKVDEFKNKPAQSFDEQQYLKQIQELNEKLQAASADAQWKIANSTSEMLKKNLEMLEVTAGVLKSKNRS